MNPARFTHLGDEYNLIKKVIPHYDEFQDAIGEAVKRHCSKINSATILVVEGGVGTGLTTMRILRADERIRIIGIDNEDKILKQARTFLRDYDDRITYREEDLLAAMNGMSDENVDIFASAQTIHNFPQQYRLQLFNEVARVLKPNGLFINGDKYARDDEEMHVKDFQERLANFELFDSLGRPDLRQEWTRHNEEDDKIKLSEGEQVEVLQRLGFHDVYVAYRNGMEAIVVAIH